MSEKKIVNGVIGVVAVVVVAGVVVAGVGVAAGVALLVIAFRTGSNGTDNLLNVLANVWILFGITISAFLTICIVLCLIEKAWKLCKKMKRSDNQGASAKQNEAGQPESYKSYLSIKTDFVYIDNQSSATHHNEVSSKVSSADCSAAPPEGDSTKQSGAADEKKPPECDTPAC